MMAHGGAWWCMVVHGGAWWCVVVRTIDELLAANEASDAQQLTAGSKTQGAALDVREGAREGLGSVEQRAEVSNEDLDKVHRTRVLPSDEVGGDGGDDDVFSPRGALSEDRTCERRGVGEV
jgi:hypothetical protein